MCTGLAGDWVGPGDRLGGFDVIQARSDVAQMRSERIYFGDRGQGRIKWEGRGRGRFPDHSQGSGMNSGDNLSNDPSTEGPVGASVLAGQPAGRLGKDCLQG